MWLYKLTNRLNGKQYIGTSINPVSHRISRHLYAAKNNRDNCMAITRAIRKYSRTRHVDGPIPGAPSKKLGKHYQPLSEMHKKSISESMKRARAEKFWSTRIRSEHGNACNSSAI